MLILYRTVRERGGGGGGARGGGGGRKKKRRKNGGRVGSEGSRKDLAELYGCIK